MPKTALFVVSLILFGKIASAQIENVHIAHPVYMFLERAQTRGLLENFAMAELPLARARIVGALALLREKEAALDNAEESLLSAFEREFGLREAPRAVMFASDSDSTQLFFGPLFGSGEKFVYHYTDSNAALRLEPLASLELRLQQGADSSRNVGLGQFGLRLHGSLSNTLGYYLQVSNGAVLTGDRELALEDPLLRRNVKFGELESDFDFTDSHIRVEHEWFFASLGRQKRLSGAAYFSNIFLSNNAAPSDAISLGAQFDSFEYRFSHLSLLALPVTNFQSGPEALIPAKYMAYHRFDYRARSFQVGLVESVVYGDRNIDLAYLNPLSFFKSIEHSLRDRDNSALGLDATLRPLDGLELRGSFFLDDIQFSRIGDDFSGNKSAFTIGMMMAPQLPLDLTLEYSRVNPYTYSHFNVQNSFTNDGLALAGNLPPNADELRARLQYWWGNRYPLQLSAGYRRHGRNIYGESSEGPVLLKNVGGDILMARRSEDSEIAPFLDGDVERQFTLSLAAGVELLRGFNIQALYQLSNLDGSSSHQARLALRFGEF